MILWSIDFVHIDGTESTIADAWSRFGFQENPIRNVQFGVDPSSNC